MRHSSGKAKKNDIRSSRRFFIRNNKKALKRRRQFLRSKMGESVEATEQTPETEKTSIG